MQIAVPPDASLLIIRAVGDEASAVISFFQITTWVMTRLGLLYLKVLSSPFDLAERFDVRLKAKHKLLRHLLLSCPLALLVIDFTFILWLGRDILTEMERPLFECFVATDLYPIGLWLQKNDAVISTLLAAPVILLAIGIIIGSSLPIGASALIGAMIYEVTVEPTPLGRWIVHQVRPEPSRSGLMHSSSHENEEALTAVTEWINKT